MSFILVCLGVLQQAAAGAGHASPKRRLVVVALSGFYLTAVGWWAGSRLRAAWRERDRDYTGPEDSLG